jgi:hypothetical protein
LIQFVLEALYAVYDSQFESTRVPHLIH